MRVKTNAERKRSGEEGFTLVELLIVLAILAVLVAVVLPNFTGLLGGAKDTASDAELTIVQTAVDAKMASLGVATTDAVTNTNDMGPSGFDLYPDYMRSSTTSGYYSCDTTGQVLSGTAATPTPP